MEKVPLNQRCIICLIDRFCVVLAFLFCSGGGYWYHRRYIQQGMIIGPPQTTTVVTMTTTTTGSVDGTCTGIPTGKNKQNQVLDYNVGIG